RGRSVSIRRGPRGCADAAELAARSGSVSDACRRAPIPGQKLVDALGRMIWQPSEDVGEPGLRIDVVELCGRDERVDSSRPPTTFVRAGEGPVPAPDRDGALLALGGIVGNAYAAVIEEAGERTPAFETVVDGLASLAVFGNPGALLAQPLLQFD